MTSTPLLIVICRSHLSRGEGGGEGGALEAGEIKNRTLIASLRVANNEKARRLIASYCRVLTSQQTEPNHRSC